MSEKRLLQAAVLLVRSLKMINSTDMLEIGAVADLRSYLNGQEAVYVPILKYHRLFAYIGHRLYEISSSMSFRTIFISNPSGVIRDGRPTFPTNKPVSKFNIVQVYFKG
jgi:hypothetical protein